MELCVLLLVIVINIFLVRTILHMLRQNAYVKNLPRISIKLLFPMIRPNKTSTDIYDYLHKISNEYDGLAKFWLGSQLMVICDDPENLKTIFLSKDCLDRPYLYQMTAGTGNGIFSARTHVWRPDRKRINTVFTVSILKTFIPKLNAHFTTLVQNLEKYVDHAEIDMTNHIFQCIFDVICATTLRFDYQTQSGSNGKALKSIEKLLQISVDRLAAFILHPKCFYRFSSLYAEEKKLVDYLCAIAPKVLSHYHSNNNQLANEKGPDAETENAEPMILIDKLIQMEQRGEMSRQRVHDQILTFLIAGTDTTALITLNTLLLLAIHQNVQDRLYEEIHTTVSDVNCIDCNVLSKLEYMERVLKESMRLLPVTHIVMRQTEADVKLTECTVPKGTILLLCIQKMHRDVKIWGPTANEFDPERFLPELVAQRHPFSYLPFLAGARNCIGSKMALQTLKVVLCHLLLHYKFGTSMRMSNIVFKTEMLLKLENKYMLNLERRC